ncbi:Chitobiosyldiphosphodolichol beta-mannosyltransferase [Spathaspora passalidarum NRRL Y-27907]|uniref:Chitobiosyldiphosphodolichol beta-mannosyltransferase n=1 Tax=Spathaspora passalidarum (strain NRRL Y-27907 / 11-Y1) TaxID=619300 RepID=G3AE53_SPAPN|nr:Chitobiosyldiphosphodolichol beta-mannosyltransferase [Spathaspora passalidarum NRRL Y-27907]EGW35587.1 Chitobiosyldiphosphodolichol beta-mannosyltransferase [Spathaspora passalidarum NRRL Y-27907]
MDYTVNLCGYLETEPPLKLIDDINIDINEIKAVKNTNGLPFILFAMLKVCVQVKQIFQLLFANGDSDFILIQNPPSIPLLAIIIVYIAIFNRNCKLIIDWHNLNYSILNLRYQNLNHPLVKLVKFYEQWLGKFAWLNITVTNQMSKFLVQEFGFPAQRITTLYDRPGDQFQPLAESKSDVMSRFDLFDKVQNIDSYKILVTSTSFTPDEDFEILLQALKQYHDTKNVPPVLLIVTGKGPLKQQFLERVIELDFSSKVIVKTAWLASEDYPTILSLADLGVSLHTSSSGIDLPMKIVDFFGCGIPVVSLSFPAINELVKEGVNGLLVTSDDKSSEMCKLFIKVFTSSELSAKLKLGALQESNLRWDQNWSTVLGKTFEY